MKPCLVLNGDYRVLGIVSWERAVTLTYQRKAHCIEYYQDKIQGATREYPLPAVIVLSEKFIKFFRTKVKLKKRNIFIRDKFKCGYCGNKFAGSDLTVDHVHPRLLGGKTTWINVISSCLKCNRKKGHNLIKPLWKPYEPKHNQVFLIDKIQPEWKNYVPEM